MIVVTGVAGFIGSCVASGLNERGRTDLLVSDDFLCRDREPAYCAEKDRNWQNLQFTRKEDRTVLLQALEGLDEAPEAVIHLGARTDTAETDRELFNRLNLNYSQAVWNYCALHGVPLVYASSAATYGDGSQGFSDDHGIIPSLQPLNRYGESKNDFDRWALEQAEAPPFWAGLKFFNVYGPNEYHKKRMASVILHAFHQINHTGSLALFRSHHPGYGDGEQMRDFIYVRDVVKVILFLLERRPESGIYNLGTGTARTFLDLGNAVFRAMGQEPSIRFIDTPPDIREKYQYYTRAEMEKLRAAGFTDDFTSLEAGIGEYVNNFLVPGRVL